MLPQVQFFLREDVFETFAISENLTRAAIKVVSPNFNAKTTVASSKSWVE